MQFFKIEADNVFHHSYAKFCFKMLFSALLGLTFHFSWSNAIYSSVLLDVWS